MDDPLFKVDFKKIIPDTLHLFLFLRTCEILVENLQEWAVKAKKRQELEEAAFKAGVNMRCEEDKNGTYVWSDLNGCELEKLMKNIDLSPLLADHPHHDNILFAVTFTPQVVHCSSSANIIPKLPQSSRVSSHGQALLAQTSSCAQRYQYHPLYPLPCFIFPNFLKCTELFINLIVS